ncbi:MAG: hypothetical protein JXN61_18025 [Sedimentisphaerales bacterium]|nr:hypothetical protein [Sedimentisphaerales bacterium]
MARRGYGKFVAAGLVFAGFAASLFWWRLEGLKRWELLLPVNSCTAALGCYVLSRRWVSSFLGSLFAGAIYGFGPFMLGLGKFHPTAGFLAASIPWLLCPAAFGGKTKWRRNAGLLVIFPFAAIVLFFEASAHYGLFPVSIRIRLGADDLVSLFAPLVAAEHDIVNTTMVGFYHIPTAALVMGCAMLLAARRLHIIALLLVGVGLGCCRSFFEVSPVMWLSIPAVCCSVMIGAGIEGLTLAGPADRKWLLTAAIIQGGGAIAALFLATKYFQVFLGLGDTYARLFVQTAEMYVLGAVAVLILFFTTGAKLGIRPIRWAILCLSMGIDIYLAAGFIIARVL